MLHRILFLLMSISCVTAAIVCSNSLAVIAEESRDALDYWGDPLPSGAIARLGSVRLQHPDIEDMELAPDGRSVMTSGGKTHGGLCCWDITSGKRLLHICRKGHCIHAIYYPDGQRIITGDDAGCISVYDTSTGREQFKAVLHNQSIACLAIADNCQYLATGGNDNIINVVDWQTKKVKHALTTSHPVTAMAFSPQGKHLLGIDGQFLCAWDVATGKCLYQKTALHGSALAIAHKGNICALGRSSRQDNLSLYDLSNGELIRRITGHSGNVTSLCFSLDSSTLFSCSDDNTVRAWSTGEGKEIAKIGRHHQHPRYVRFSSTAKHVVTADCIGNVRVWSSNTFCECTQHLRHYLHVTCIAFSPSGSIIATGGVDSTIRLWDSTSGRCLRQLNLPNKSLVELHFSENGKLLASLDQRNCVSVWHSSHWHLSSRFFFPKRIIHGFTFCDHGSSFAYVDENGRLRILNAENGKERRSSLRMLSRESAICQAVFSSDARSNVGCLQSHTPDGKHSLCFFDLQNAQTFRTVATDSAAVLCFADRDRIIQGEQTRVEVWDWRKGVRLDCVQLSVPTWFFSGTLSPNNELLAIGCVNGQILLIDVETWSVLRAYRGHTAEVLALAFSPDGKTLASGASDGSAYVWDLLETKLASQRNVRLGDKELLQLWGQLGDENASLAYTAICRLSTFTDRSLPLLKARLHPVPAVNHDAVVHLIQNLDNEEFRTRDNASRKLHALGEGAEPILRRIRDNDTCTPEQRRRITDILHQFEVSKQRKQHRRALLVLEFIHSPEARALVESMAHGAPNAYLTIAAKASLHRMTRSLPDQTPASSR